MSLHPLAVVLFILLMPIIWQLSLSVHVFFIVTGALFILGAVAFAPEYLWDFYIPMALAVWVPTTISITIELARWVIGERRV